MAKLYNGRLITDVNLYAKIKEVVEYIIKYEPLLDIHIRENYVNIYYKGGSIVKILSEKSIELNPFYFYHESTKKIGGNRKPSDHIKGNRKKGIPRDVVMYNELILKRDNAKRLFMSGEYNLYFTEVKYAMDKYWWSLGRISGERKDQQDICLSNRLTTDSDYTVLDTEFEVSTLSEYSITNNSHKINPRFDIIAIDNSIGKLVVIELKTGTKALDNNSGLREHYNNFNESIAVNSKKFINEMQLLLKQKQDLGILQQELQISHFDVEFMFAFTYSTKEDMSYEDQLKEFSTKCSAIDPNLRQIIIGDNYKLCK